MDMTLVLRSESTLTDRYQTTIPEPIRKALGLGKRDRICYSIHANGQVTIARAEQEDDPLLGQFLSFLAQDIEQNPHRIQGISSDLVKRAQDLVAGAEIDLDAPLSDEDE